MKSLTTTYLKIIPLILLSCIILFAPNLNQLKTTVDSEIIQLIVFYLCSVVTFYLLFTILMELSNLNIEIILSSIVAIGSLFNLLYLYMSTNGNIGAFIYIYICTYAEFLISIGVFYASIIKKIFYKIDDSFKEVQ